MESSGVPEMLRILDKEAIVLNQMHRRISNGLNRLQVEAEIFMRALERLGLTQISSTKTEEEDAAAETEKAQEGMATVTEDSDAVGQLDLEKTNQSSSSHTLNDRENGSVACDRVEALKAN
eukprot:c20784_g1_i2 orf=517-879(+)